MNQSMDIQDIRAIAGYQRGVLLCILLQLMAVGAHFVLPHSLRPLLALGVLLDYVAATVFVFLLSTKIYSTGPGVVLGVLTLVPCLGLIVLLALAVTA